MYRLLFYDVIFDYYIQFKHKIFNKLENDTSKEKIHKREQLNYVNLIFR